MKKNFEAKNSLFDVILVAVCSFVGVGFISGAEIWFYFARFGASGVFGLILFGMLVFVLGLFAFRGVSHSNPKIKKLKTKILLFSELAVASAMVSGLFETSRTLFSKWWVFVFALAILALILLFFSEKKSFVIYNYFVAIFVIFVVISLFLFNNNFVAKNSEVLIEDFSAKNIFLSLLFGLIYVFMNISEIRPILERNSKNFNKKEKILLSLFLSLMLIFLVFMLSFVLLKNKHLASFSMPFLMNFKEKGGWVLMVFLIGLVMTMISTANACMIGAKDKLIFHKNDDNFAKIIVILSSLIFGQIPFVFFIKIIYPILAVLNFWLFVFELFERREKVI